ncbi:hypothetical protein AAMO2058_001230900 [Amorphochlora amoebiformis]
MDLVRVVYTLLPCMVTASHLRFGTIDWTVEDLEEPTRVTFHYYQAVRGSYESQFVKGTYLDAENRICTSLENCWRLEFSNSYLFLGDGDSILDRYTYHNYGVSARYDGATETRVYSDDTAIDIGRQNWFMTERVAYHTYQTTEIFETFYSSCCRQEIGTRNVETGEYLTMKAKVNLNEVYNGVTQNPHCAFFAVVFWPFDQSVTLTSSLRLHNLCNSPFDSNLQFVWSTADDSGLQSNGDVPWPGLVNPVLSEDGILTWAPNQDGLYAFQFGVEDKYGNTNVVDLIFDVMEFTDTPYFVEVRNGSTSNHSTPVTTTSIYNISAFSVQVGEKLSLEIWAYAPKGNITSVVTSWSQPQKSNITNDCGSATKYCRINFEYEPLLGDADAPFCAQAFSHQGPYVGAPLDPENEVSFCMQINVVNPPTPMPTGFPTVSQPPTTPEPTPGPTAYPTRYPTLFPTPKPSMNPTSMSPSTDSPLTCAPSVSPSSTSPSTLGPTSFSPTNSPATLAPSTTPTTDSPATPSPSLTPVTQQPSTTPSSESPVTFAPSFTPTTATPSLSPITRWPTYTRSPSSSPTTGKPTTLGPTTMHPITKWPTYTYNPSTSNPTSGSPTTIGPYTVAPTPPTHYPSPSPTFCPTISPTSNPSVTPSTSTPSIPPPTPSPAIPPTKYPTFDDGGFDTGGGGLGPPTKFPTLFFGGGSFEPTGFPTLSPTDVPSSLMPTYSPLTLAPTITVHPTAHPSLTPSSLSPRTLSPTYSLNPTCNPTTPSPTRSPSSAQPTMTPSTGSPSSSAPSDTPTTSAPSCTPTTGSPTSDAPTETPTTATPSQTPTSCSPSSANPSQTPTTMSPTQTPTTCGPTTGVPSQTPTTLAPSETPTTCSPSTCSPSSNSPSTCGPTSCSPSTGVPSQTPTTLAPSETPTTCSPSTCSPSSNSPSTCGPTSHSPSTGVPSQTPTTLAPSETPTTCSPSTCSPSSNSPSTCGPTSTSPSTGIPSQTPTTLAPSETPTTCSPSTCSPSSNSPSTCGPTSCSPSTGIPSQTPTTLAPSESPTTCSPSTCSPSTNSPSSCSPTSLNPSTLTPSSSPTTVAPSNSPSTCSPSTCHPSSQSPSSCAPTSLAPSTGIPTSSPTSLVPSFSPTSCAPSTQVPSTCGPSSQSPSTLSPSTNHPTSQSPTTIYPSTTHPSTMSPSSTSPSSVSPTSLSPTSAIPSSGSPTTLSPSSLCPSSSTPLTQAPSQTPTTLNPSVSPTSTSPSTLTPTQSPSETPCPSESDGWGEDIDCLPLGDGRMFHFLRAQTRTYEEAQAKCQSYGLDIPSIHSMGENEGIYDLLSLNISAGSTDAERRAWIGLRDNLGEGVGSGSFSWDDLSTVNYLNWASGEPQSSPDSNPRCVLLNGQGATYPTYWSTISCSSSAQTICLKPYTLSPSSSNPTQTPTTQSPTVTPTTLNPATVTPSVSPVTAAPVTAEPSHAPSLTYAPTETPTTLSPSSLTPTQNPTITPSTINPTSDSPLTVTPSVTPTESPVTTHPVTYIPSVTPTGIPSGSPVTVAPITWQPTHSPIFTTQPSFSPSTSSPSTSTPTSTEPTNCPTFLPTVSPVTTIPTTLQPTRSPSSIMPTICPTVVPSIHPTTDSPSLSPSSSTPHSVHPITLEPVTIHPTVSPSTNSPQMKPDAGSSIGKNEGTSSTILIAGSAGGAGFLLFAILIAICCCCPEIFCLALRKKWKKIPKYVIDWQYGDQLGGLTLPSISLQTTLPNMLNMFSLLHPSKPAEWIETISKFNASVFSIQDNDPILVENRKAFKAQLDAFLSQTLPKAEDTEVSAVGKNQQTNKTELIKHATISLAHIDVSSILSLPPAKPGQSFHNSAKGSIMDSINILKRSCSLNGIAKSSYHIHEIYLSRVAHTLISKLRQSKPEIGAVQNTRDFLSICLRFICTRHKRNDPEDDFIFHIRFREVGNVPVRLTSHRLVADVMAVLELPIISKNTGGYTGITNKNVIKSRERQRYYTQHRQACKEDQQLLPNDLRAYQETFNAFSKVSRVPSRDIKDSRWQSLISGLDGTREFFDLSDNIRRSVENSLSNPSDPSFDFVVSPPLANASRQRNARQRLSVGVDIKSPTPRLTGSNTTSRRSSLPSGWFSSLDKKSGQMYYYNKVGEKSWVEPTSGVGLHRKGGSMNENDFGSQSGANEIDIGSPRSSIASARSGLDLLFSPTSSNWV